MPATNNNPETRTGNAATALALTAFVALAAYLSVALIQPPTPAPIDAPPTEFSSARATEHLRAVAREPHPTGSDASVRVREYILSELAALGISAEVQRATAVWESRRREQPSQAATVHNIVARMAGSASGAKALMLAAHYDSAPTGPGASDDGAGVAAILETVRALKTGAPLKQDLIVLFTDGEELGLLGARAFSDEHTWMRDVGLVLNFEARGRGGPSFMFETSEGNEALIAEFARAAPRPVANSLMYALYKRLPNDTDLTVFKAAGAAGLNFAYVSDITHYHTALDAPERADERSLQHHGSYALALARHFGNLDLAPLSGAGRGDAVYFNALGPVFVSYPEAWAALLTAVVALAFAVVVCVGWRRARLSAGGVGLGLALPAVCVLAAVVAGAGGSRLIARLHTDYRALPFGTPYDAWRFEWALVLLVVAVCAAVYAAAGRRAGASSLTIGAMLWWLLLLFASTALLPGGSFLFAWPLLFALVGLSYTFFGRSRATWMESAMLAAGAAPAVVLGAPIVYMLFVLLGAGTSAPALVLAALLASLLLPLLRLSAARGAWLLSAAAGVSAFAFFVAGVTGARFDAERPRINSVFYEMNADTGQARWVSADAAPDAWTSQFFAATARRDVSASVFPWETGTVLTGEARTLDAPPPALQVLEDRADGWLRRVRLRISSQRGAPLMLVYTGAEAEVQSAEVGGKKLAGAGEAGNQLRVFYTGVPVEGLDVRLEVNASRPLKLTVVDGAYGLPETFGIAPRPSGMMPKPSKIGDVTLVRKSFTL